jgi:site-specific DNA recombinase
MPLRIGLYVRISRDREGAGLGVDRQAAECRELASRMGWTIVTEYIDNDLSAYSGKPRPGYRRLLEDIRAGRIDGVLVWHTDRLHRSPAELEEYISACDVRGTPTMTVKAGRLDLSTPSGRMVARTLGNIARYEVEHMIERQQSAKLQAAADGRWKGGRRPYGYEDDGVTVRQDEAAEVLAMTDAIMAGTSIRTIVRDLNQRGLTTSTGVPWRADAVRAVLLRPRNAGLMEHQGKIIGKASWPAIVPEPRWRAVHARLTDPKRRNNGVGTARRWLGSGVYSCGVCGGIIRGEPARTERDKPVPPTYVCIAHKCVTRRADEVDRYVGLVVVERLARPDAVDLLRPAVDDAALAGLVDEAADLRGKKDGLARLLVEEVLTEAGVRAESERIAARLAEIEATMAAGSAGSELAGLPLGTPEVAAAWQALSLDRKRRVIHLLMTVTLLPSPKGRPPGWRAGASYFRPDTVRCEPRKRAGQKR